MSTDGTTGVVRLESGKLHNVRKIRRALSSMSESLPERKTFANGNGITSASPAATKGGFIWTDEQVIQFCISNRYDLTDPTFIDGNADRPDGITIRDSGGYSVVVGDGEEIGKAISRLYSKAGFKHDRALSPYKGEQGGSKGSGSTGQSPAGSGGNAGSAGSTGSSPTVAKATAAATAKAETETLEPGAEPREAQPEKKDAVGTTGHEVADDKDGFDAKGGYKIATALRQAVEGGTADEAHNLNPRRFIRWAWFTNILLQEGCGERQAHDLAFNLALTWSLPEGEQEFVIETYRQMLGRSPLDVWQPTTKGRGIPAAIENVRKDMEAKLSQVVLPETALLAIMASHNVPAWIHGPKGSGKSVGAVQALKYLGHADPLRIQGSEDTHPSELFGDKGLTVEDGASKTEFEPSGLTIAALEGRAPILDEWDTFAHTVHTECHALLEGNPIVIRQTGQEVPWDLPIIAPCNTVGLGESPNYVGTRMVNSATRDRFCWIPYGKIDEDLELHMVKLELGRLMGWASPEGSKAPLAKNADAVRVTFG